MSYFIEMSLEELDDWKKYDCKNAITWTSDSMHPEKRWLLIKNDRLCLLTSWLQRSDINVICVKK